MNLWLLTKINVDRMLIDCAEIEWFLFGSRLGRKNASRRVSNPLINADFLLNLSLKKFCF